jgi:hypothetical protein
VQAVSHDIYGEACRIHGSNPGLRQAQTHVVELFMAGDIGHAKQVIRLFCADHSICVTVTPTLFVYAGGEEAGFVVGFRNYPRFPSAVPALWSKAAILGDTLLEELGQDSWMCVEAGGMTSWRSKRDVR